MKTVSFEIDGAIFSETKKYPAGSGKQETDCPIITNVEKDADILRAHFKKRNG
jgi:hypothetical protein